MNRKLDKIVVIDLEATCWKSIIPEGRSNEIIEIGICLIDTQTHELSDNRSIIVKPEKSEISEFCTELTTLTQEQVDQGISLKEASEILKSEYLSRSRVWASYGAYDLNQFTKECLNKKIDYPFSPSHINVKTLFAIKQKLQKEVGMSSALDILGIELEGTHHRGVDDAKNISKILVELLK